MPNQFNKKFNDACLKVCSNIDKNLSNDFTLEQLSNIAHLSKYHFSRLFTLHMGITVFQYIQSARMKKAATQVFYHDQCSITDIAFDAGFQNVESFSRAFKRVFLVSPTEFKKTPNWLPLTETVKPIIKSNIIEELIMNTLLNVNVEWFSQTKIALLKHVGSPVNLPTSIKQFIAWRKSYHTPPSVSKTFNIIYDDPSMTPAEKYRFGIASNIDTDVVENTQGVVTCHIPEGQCAVIRHVGSDEQLGPLINALYTHWLPNSSYELRDFPCFFERVKMFPTVSSNEAITDIYLPVYLPNKE